MIKLGTTFWGGSPDDPATKHLWFVISDPDTNHGLAIIANMTTYRAGSEECCVLQPGDHPAVKHKSVINYLRACNVPVANIEKAHKSRPDCIVFAEAADRELIIRILQGALKSKLINTECLAIAHRELKRCQSSSEED
jgi:hypothetical protein